MNDVIVWKPTVIYPEIYASNTGLIKNIKSGKILKQREMKTTKGSYLYVYFQAINNGKCTRKTTGVHRLICMAFHGAPENYEKLDVNHKDCIKHNNSPSNLEWATRSDNVKHAFTMGANKHALQSEITDIFTGITHSFVSTQRVEEFLGLTKGMGIHVITAHLSKPYLDRYLFKIIGKYQPKKSDCVDPLYCLDFTKGKFYRFENRTQMQMVTGISNSCTAYLLKGEFRLFNGYCVCRVNDVAKLFTYIGTINQEIVDQSIIDYNKYTNRVKTDTSNGWLVKNYFTNEILEFECTQDVENYTGVKNLSGDIKGRVFRLYRGKSIKLKDDPTDFIDYSDDYIRLSLTQSVNKGQPVRITHLASNTTKDWATLRSFAKTIDAIDFFKKHPKLFMKKFNNEYSFEKIKVTN